MVRYFNQGGVAKMTIQEEATPNKSGYLSESLMCKRFHLEGHKL
jgi:hypothetical protein